jgi:hypothetical protein
MPYKDKEKEKEKNRRWRQNNLEKARQTQRDWQAANKEKCKEYSHNWRINNPERAKEQSRANNKRHPERMREKAWRDRGINLTVAEYNLMLEGQDGLCAICKKPQDVFKKWFAVDHDHHTGKIRGLLCFHCNSGIGKFEDSLELLVRAVDYIKQSL